MNFATSEPSAQTCGLPASLGIREKLPGATIPLRQAAEGDARGGPLVGHDLHRAFIEREGRSDTLLGDLHVGRSAFDADPTATKPSRHGAGCPGTEEWIEPTSPGWCRLARCGKARLPASASDGL